MPYFYGMFDTKVQCLSAMAQSLYQDISNLTGGHTQYITNLTVGIQVKNGINHEHKIGQVDSQNGNPGNDQSL